MWKNTKHGQRGGSMTDSRDSTSQVCWGLHAGQSPRSPTPLPLPHVPLWSLHSSQKHQPRATPGAEHTHHTGQCSQGLVPTAQWWAPTVPLFFEVALIRCDTIHLPLQSLGLHTYSTTVTIFFSSEIPRSDREEWGFTANGLWKQTQSSANSSSSWGEAVSQQFLALVTSSDHGRSPGGHGHLSKSSPIPSPMLQ